MINYQTPKLIPNRHVIEKKNTSKSSRTQLSDTTSGAIVFGVVRCTWVHIHQTDPDAVVPGIRSEAAAWRNLSEAVRRSPSPTDAISSLYNEKKPLNAPNNTQNGKQKYEHINKIAPNNKNSQALFRGLRRWLVAVGETSPSFSLLQHSTSPHPQREIV